MTKVAARELAHAADVSAGSAVFLTFDDGPDPTFTMQVLDVLKAMHYDPARAAVLLAAAV